MKPIDFGERTLGPGNPALIIGELSCNHLQQFDLAMESVDAMHAAGIDCVKLQTARPESLTLDCDRDPFVIKGGTLWDGKTYFELYQETHTPWEWHEPIMRRANELGMLFMSSPFDLEAVEFLDELGVPGFKIASFEITDIALIAAAAAKGKPVILSTGIAEEDDIRRAVDTCREAGNDRIVLTKCTSAYPAPIEEANLKAIPALAETFDCLAGLSDHSPGSAVAVGAVALGACVIEKHFITDRSLGGPDAAFSLEPAEFASLVEDVRRMEAALGTGDLALSEKSRANRASARSLFVVEDMKAGEKFTPVNVRSIRPGHGLEPRFLPKVLGARAGGDIARGTQLSWELIAEAKVDAETKKTK